jgi:uncharacterized iron-regulated protein
MLCGICPAIACPMPDPPPPAMTELLSELPKDHPLIGDWYVPEANLLVSLAQPGQTCPPTPPIQILADILAKQTAQFAFILLGEIHDNPWHHKIRATLLRILEGQRRMDTAWSTAYQTPGIVFEQLTTDMQAELDGFNARLDGEKTADTFLRTTNWSSSAWAQFDYRPLFDAALKTKMPIYAGDVPKSVIRQAAKQGEAAIAPDERTRLKLDLPLPANQQDAILTELEASHCGMMPKTAFGRMAFAQRLRDATLAEAAVAAHDARDSAIVMAGNGHVRGDRGIAWYIRQRAPGVKVVTVALVEVEDGKTDPTAYVPLDPEGRPAVDYVVFTPKHDRPDPCDAFKKKP